MRKLSLLIVLLCLLIYQKSKAQVDVKTDPHVAALLRQAANGQPDLVISARKEMSGRYVNMAVLDKTRKTLTWFTCHGVVYDSSQLRKNEYDLIAANTIDPFNFYKELCKEKLNYLKDAQAEFRLQGKVALEDTGHNRQIVYNSQPVKSAKSTLQQLMAIESLIKKQYLRLYLFNSPSPSQLSPNDNFLLNKSLAGKMMSKPDTIIYYAVSPLDKVAKMAVHKQDSLKMFVYDGAGQVLDSFPLRSGKYASLLKSKDDVFLLYRGWLELRSQQVQEALQQIGHLQHRKDTSLYLQTSWVEKKQQLLLAEAELRAQQQDIEQKINTLVVPDEQSVRYTLQNAYPDKPTEIAYLSGIGFGYTISTMRGEKVYELSDHRGNVMATVSDKKMEIDNGDGTVAYYNADVVNANDYYPFGSLMPDRTYSSNEKYRYGFNGKENDNEVKGNGNQVEYGLRIYDTRVGRFLSVDPITKSYPWYTPYQFAGNTPIQSIDLDGGEEKHYTLVLNKNGTTTLTQTSVKEIAEIPLWLRIVTLGVGHQSFNIPERVVVDYEGKNYYIGFKGSYGKGNENGMALFNEFKKNPDATLFPKMFLDESRSYNTEGFKIAMELQNNTVMYGSLIEEAWYTRTLENAKTTTVYRTQGGELPNASRSRVSFDANGNVNIEGNEMLYVTLNDKAHQVYFFQKRGGAGKDVQIVSFEIPQSLAEEIVANGVPQAQGKAYPNSPQISDPGKSNSAYGLPKAYIDKLRQQAIPGTGKVEIPNQ